MKILVVHDRAKVAQAIADICIDLGVDGGDISIVPDAVSARAELGRTLFDIAIVDLTLPHIKNRDDPSYAVADQLLSEIYLTEHLNVPGDIIGITQESSALKLVATSIASNVMTIVEQNEADDRWKTCLREKVEYIQRASSQRLIAANAQHDYDVLIVTALDKELRPYREFYDFSDMPLFPRAYSFGFPASDGAFRKGVAFAIGTSGEARAASYTQSLLSLFRPKLALMTGICGGVPEKTGLGDIVFAESAFDWDYGKWVETGGDAESSGKQSRFVSRPDPHSIRGSRAHGVVRDLIDTRLLDERSFQEEIERASKGLISRYKSHLAPFGSGSSVIASDQILQQVRALNESIRGVDMECYGFYQAVRTTHVLKPEALCIKAVSDYSNGTKNDEYHEGCSFASARVAQVIMENLWNFTRHP